MEFLLGLAVGALLGVVGTAAVFMSRKRARPAPANVAGADVFRQLLGQPAGGDASPAARPGGEDLESLRQNLRVKLLYQEDKVDAAIAAERERNPSGTPAELMRAAIDRWERDNR